VKAVIVTTAFTPNCGAMLQAYALNRVVRGLGHAAVTLDYRGEPMKGRVLRLSRRWSSIRRDIHLARCWGASRRWLARFAEFRQQHVPLTPRVYSSPEDLLAQPPEADVSIAGSDQVWHPLLLDRPLGHVFHLSFADPERSRLVAYAASFGATSVPPRHTETVRRYLNRYNALSVRETEGQKLVLALTGRHAEHVLDPTLLLDPAEYAEVAAAPQHASDYLLVYPMETGVRGEFVRLVRELKHQLARPLVCVCPTHFSPAWMELADELVLDAGPAEFLTWVRDATFVCTNSFHGTALSVLFRRPFLGTPHSSYNCRVSNLLGQLGLQDRQISDPDGRAVERALATPTDYAAVGSRLRDLVRHSRAYLAEALKG
jgi:hypothetical protein